MTPPHLTFRLATRDDLPAIVRMLVDDALGNTWDRCDEPLSPAYYEAFQAIQSDKNNELVIAQSGGEVVGVLQLTYIPGLLFQGGWRALIEGVRVSSSVRGLGVGSAFLKWAIARADARGCHLAQLTSNKLRTDAKRFYERLGFQATHEGMKLPLRRARKS
jgi:ribosomal protein S18 acetylase RimI-like enzyme